MKKITYFNHLTFFHKSYVTIYEVQVGFIIYLLTYTVTCTFIFVSIYKTNEEKKCIIFAISKTVSDTIDRKFGHQKPSYIIYIFVKYREQFKFYLFFKK